MVHTSWYRDISIFYNKLDSRGAINKIIRGFRDASRIRALRLPSYPGLASAISITMCVQSYYYFEGCWCRYLFQPVVHCPFYRQAHPEARTRQPYMPRLLTSIHETHHIKKIQDGISFESSDSESCEGIPCLCVLSGRIKGDKCPLCTERPQLRQELSNMNEQKIKEEWEQSMKVVWRQQKRISQGV